jgi:hypothetical protein
VSRSPQRHCRPKRQRDGHRSHDLIFPCRQAD